MLYETPDSGYIKVKAPVYILTPAEEVADPKVEEKEKPPIGFYTPSRPDPTKIAMPPKPASITSNK